MAIANNLFHFFHPQVNPNENLPVQICDLCIVQLNVSYNFKRLALKNDFQIRQYMIENGMSLTKDEDRMETTTALEIHQIQHNVIRTNRYRQIAAPEIRRNSTTSSLSGTSAMMMNVRENDATPTNTPPTSNFVTPRPMVRPIQIKEEPVDPDEAKESSPSTSSPSNSSEPASVVTVYSSIAPSEKRPPPMIVINGIVNNESFEAKRKATADRTTGPAPLSVKMKRKAAISDMPKEKPHNLRTIRKKPDSAQNGRLLRKAVDKAVQRASSRFNAKKTTTNLKKLQKDNVKVIKKDNMTIPKKRGRPRKYPEQPQKLSHKKQKS